MKAQESKIFIQNMRTWIAGAGLRGAFRKRVSILRVFFLAGFALSLAGCDTAAMRIPGLSFSFPETDPAFHSAHVLQESVSVALPVDHRSEYLDQEVAHADWKSCSSNSLDKSETLILVRERLKSALDKAALFNAASTSNMDAPWLLTSELQVSCVQSRGFVFRRLAGMTSIKFTLTKNGKAVWQQTIAHVVTDADPEYTGSSVGTVEQGLHRVLADSMRLVFKDALVEIGKVAALEGQGQFIH